MDRVNEYRKAIQRVLNEISDASNRSLRPQRADDARSHCVFDTERDHYLLLTTGWDGRRRAHGFHIYARIVDGKIRVEDDWTDWGFVDELLAAGIPKEDIVLAWQHPETRKETEFAPA